MSEAFPTQWPVPVPMVFTGTHVILTPFSLAEDIEELFAAGHDGDEAKALWEYMPGGPFKDVEDMRAFFAKWQALPDVVVFTVSNAKTGRKVGMISIMRITPQHGVAELGMIWYGPTAQRTKANTEVAYLLLRHLFDDLGYRRVEWKCDSGNERSMAAALRLGFLAESLFRQHMVIKGRNRDTAWFAMLDAEWPQRKANLKRWLYTDDSASLTVLNYPHPY